MSAQKVLYSPVGEGEVTGETFRGYPKVNFVAVTWFVSDKYEVVDFNGFLRNGNYTLLVSSDPLVKKERNFNGTLVVSSEEEAIKLIEAIDRHPFKLEVIED